MSACWHTAEVQCSNCQPGWQRGQTGHAAFYPYPLPMEDAPSDEARAIAIETLKRIAKAGVDGDALVAAQLLLAVTNGTL